MEESLYYLLEKILKRSELSQDIIPNNIDQWKNFLSRINRSFLDFEQERYLLERSMEISSKEMLELNKKFELAQSTAHIGLWIYDKDDEKILWTKEAYQIFGIDHLQAVPSYKNILMLIHEDDRKKLDNLVKNAFEKKIGYEMEFRIKNPQKDVFRWAYTSGQIQYKNNDGTKPYLSGIVMDIDTRKTAEKQLQELQEKILLTAHQAGMSEIATSVLHNIGNILNSVNVSMALMKESIIYNKFDSFLKIIKMIKENAGIPHYFTQNKKGKLIPNYLDEFCQHLLKQQDILKNTIESLDEKIQHIKDIVNMQNEISGIAQIEEKVILSEAVDIAIKMCGFSEKNHIKITKNYEEDYAITTNKVKLLQIIVNLIKNAKEALMVSQIRHKKIQIKIHKISIENAYALIIEDNGIGIPKENLEKIFSMGFTTKPNGHGFGLHSSANAAQQLNGYLSATSKGTNEGACFILKLPITHNK